MLAITDSMLSCMFRLLYEHHAFPVHSSIDSVLTVFCLHDSVLFAIMR